MKKTIPLFNSSLHDLHYGIVESITSRINSESDDYILSVGETSFLDYLKAAFLYEVPLIFWDRMEASPVKGFVNYHIPYDGQIELLSYRPSSFNLGMPLKDFTVDTDEKELIISVVDRGDAVRIQNSIRNLKDHLIPNLNYLLPELETILQSLNTVITESFERRKQQILDHRKMLSELNVPIRLSNKRSNTFSIPDPNLRKKIVIKKPVVRLGDFVTEPTLSDEYYHLILQNIDDMGKNFERLPSVYESKLEEDLRDHILVLLDPQFAMGSASGETFNKTGKTDISLRYNSSVVFVSECKFWRGEKSLLDTVDQLLSYLTWRDSKTSIVIFVKNKVISEVLNKVSDTLAGHPCFIKQLENVSAGWFNFIFRLPDDENKEIKMAVQLYHIPPIKKKIKG